MGVRLQPGGDADGLPRRGGRDLGRGPARRLVVYEQKSEDGEVVFRTWTVYMAHPPEAAEGFGARSPVMAESFAFTPAP